MPEYWRDRFCVTCKKVRRFERDVRGAWRCESGCAATSVVGETLNQMEKVNAAVWAGSQLTWGDEA